MEGVLPGQTSSGGGDAFLVKLALGNGTINGTITESARGRAVKGVVIQTDNGQSTKTDGRGNYTLPGVPAGLRIGTASKGGYATQSKAAQVYAGDTVALNFILEPAKDGGGPNCDKKPDHPKCP